MDEPMRTGAVDARHGSRKEGDSRTVRTDPHARDRDREREELRLVPPPKKQEKVLVSPRSHKSGSSRKNAHRSEKRRSWNAADHVHRRRPEHRGPKERKVSPEDVPSITAPERKGHLVELIGGQWEKRYCILRNGHLRTYKSQEDANEESEVRMRHLQLKEFQGEPDRQMCFGVNGRVFRAEDDYDVVEWVFAITGAIQYDSIMRKVKDAINSNKIDRGTVLRRMPSLRLAVDDQIVSPRSGKSLRAPSLHGNSRNGSSSDLESKDYHRSRDRKDSKEKGKDKDSSEQLTPRGSRTKETHSHSSSQLTPRGSRKMEEHSEATPPTTAVHAPIRTPSELPPAPPSSASLPRPVPESAPIAATSPSSPSSPSPLSSSPIGQSPMDDGALSPHTAKKKHKAQKAEQKTVAKAEKEARKAEEKAKKQEGRAEEKRLKQEEKAVKSVKHQNFQRQTSAPNLRAATLDAKALQPLQPLKQGEKFSTVAVGRTAALTLPPVADTERITVTTTPALQAGAPQGDGQQKQGHVMVLKKALTIPNWRKRYLCYAKGSLSIHKKESSSPSISLSMLFCSCKLGAKGRNGRLYVFEVLSPQKTYFIAVNTAAELRDWIELLQGAQAELMTQTLYASMTQLPVDRDPENTESRRLLKELRDHPENSVCADCNAEDPAWVSLNLGVFLCIECGAIHRKLGVHHSQLRSVTLDHLKLDQVQALRALGTNQQLNKTLYEAVPSPTVKKPGPEANPEEREIYIRHKYVTHTFHPSAAPLSVADSSSSIARV